MKIRSHQQQKAIELVNILNKFKCVYLRGEVRSGKTVTVLEAARLFNAKKVLFLTKKKAISSIESDHKKMRFEFALQVMNYESVHKIFEKDFDLIIYDESHSLSAFPKPAKRVKEIKSRFANIPCVLMTGTPSIESYSQYFHQFYVSNFSPFKLYTNFYRWSKDFVRIKKKRIGTHEVNDYSDANIDKIENIIAPYTVVMTQEDAGIETEINQSVIFVDVPDNIHRLAKRLIKDRAIEGKTGFIMGDMPAKLQSKVHQIYNGTVIIEKIDGSNEGIILSDYKAQAIKDRFKGKKIAVMYYYQMELEVLKNVFKDNITTDLEEFNTTDKNFAIQQSSTEGMNISKADCLVFYNFGYSGKNFVQSLDRLTIHGRKDNDVYIMLELAGINHLIYKAVKNKRSYNIKSFNKDFNIK